MIKPAILCFMCLLSVACAAGLREKPHTVSEKSLDKKEFVLTNKYEEKKITIGFEKDRVFGFAGVNRYLGTYEIKDGKIEFSKMGSTMMAGPEEAMKAENDYLNELHGLKTVSLKGDVLRIGSLIFKEKRP